MDFTTSIIGLSILIICVIIFLLLGRANQKKEKKLLQSLKELASQNNCRIVQYDIWNHAAIGIDHNANIVFAIRQTPDLLATFRVDLSEMLKCRIINARSNDRKESGNFQPIEKLELAFTHFDKNKPDTSLGFYDARIDSPHLSGEVQLAEKWCKIANDKLAQLSNKR